MKPGIKDVAKACGVSPTSVSLVLNDKPNRISEATKTLIKNTAKSMNYRPNLLSRGLVTKQNKIIGLIIPTMSDVFFSELTQNIVSSMAKRKYTVFLGYSGIKGYTEESFVEKFLDYGVEGIIISRAFKNKDYIIKNVLKILEDSNTPFIFSDNPFLDKHYPYVSIDHKLGGYLATKHLLELGHKNIGILSGTKDTNLCISRIIGYRQALEEYNIEVNEDFIIEGDFTTESGFNQLASFIERKITAIFSFNDMMTYGLYKKAKELGIRIPEDLSIVSFGQSEFNQILSPAITNISQPIDLISKEITNRLIDAIDGHSFKNSYSYYDPKLVIRNSTTKLKRRS